MGDYKAPQQRRGLMGCLLLLLLAPFLLLLLFVRSAWGFSLPLPPRPFLRNRGRTSALPATSHGGSGGGSNDSGDGNDDVWRWGRGGGGGGGGGNGGPNGVLDWRLLAAAGAAALGWTGDVEAAHAAAAAAAAAKEANERRGRGGGGPLAAFVSRNWPPRCLELVAPNSTVLDQAALDHVTQALGLWGTRLDKGKLRSVINALDQYYAQRGYIGSRVRTAYAHDNGTVVLDVLERRVASQPVSLVFVRPLKEDDLTTPQGRIENGRAKAAGAAPAIAAAATSSSSDSAVATQQQQLQGRQPEGTLVRAPAAGKNEPPLVVCKGRTRPKVIAQALGLKPGQAFRLDRERYRRLERLGPFDKAWLSLVTVPSKGGEEEQLGVELMVQERPARALEPGLSKSLHTRDWNGDLYLEDRNWLGMNQALIVKLRKGLVQARKEPCVTVSAEFHDNPLKTGVLRAFSLYRDPVSSDAIREGGSARFNLPLIGALRTALEFTADRLLPSLHPHPNKNPTSDSSATATVTALSADAGVTLGMWGGRQDVDVSVASGLAFPSGVLTSLSQTGVGGGGGGVWGEGEGFSKMQAASTLLHPLGPHGVHLALRSLGYWASRSVPPYLAYRMGGHRFYVRGFDDADFPSFSALAGSTVEARLPLMLMASGKRVGLSACLFLDYASGLRLLGSSSGRLFPSSSSSSSSSTTKTHKSNDEGSHRRLWSPLADHHVNRRDYASAGLGLRAGPVKVDWAVNHRWEGKVHISLVDPSF